MFTLPQNFLFLFVSFSSIFWKAVNFARIYAGAAAAAGLVELAFCMVLLMHKLHMSRKHASDSPSKECRTIRGPMPSDLELGRLYIKDLRSRCSRLNLTTTGGRDALIKRIEEARTNIDNLPGTPPPIQDGGEHVENENDQNALELQFQHLQHLQRQVQELLDRESPQDGLLSATQLTQVQSIVQGSLNEAIEKAAVSAFIGSSPPATAPPTQARDSSVNDALQISLPVISVSPENCSTRDPAMDSVHELPAKLVKEILTGEFMELSKLLSKHFNVLNPSQDESLTVTLENSVIKINKAKATSTTDITEWTTAFTAYMGVLISKFPHRASELLEYLSLTRYAARYHRGLG